MKKLLSFILCAAMLLGSFCQCFAGSYQDITDPVTEANAELLTKYSIVTGSEGKFYPEGTLTRAEFCTMAIAAMNKKSLVSKYAKMSIFSDVKASHWASGFINLAAKGDTENGVQSIIAGYGDGTFLPDAEISYAEAVTILLRILGYTTSDIGAVWPKDYMKKGEELGLCSSIDAKESEAITRSQAAQLFVNMLYTKTKYGVKYVKTLSVATAEITSSAAVVIVAADKSEEGFEKLAGNTAYTIRKNGYTADASDIKANDVAVYNPANNAIELCDTRVTLYYESCSPSVEKPESIKALGRDWELMKSGSECFASIKPGCSITIYLTFDGRVAYAQKTNVVDISNLAYVDSEGNISLLCAKKFISIECNTITNPYYLGKMVYIYGSNQGKAVASLAESSYNGNLYASENRIGNYKLASNVTILNGKSFAELSELDADFVAYNRVKYTRLNDAGEIDFVLLNVDIIKYTSYAVADGVPVAYAYKDGEIADTKKLEYLGSVDAKAFIGETRVSVGDKVYAVSEDAVFYNADSKTYSITLDEILEYSGSVKLYALDDTVCVVITGVR